MVSWQQGLPLTVGDQGCWWRLGFCGQWLPAATCRRLSWLGALEPCNMGPGCEGAGQVRQERARGLQGGRNRG